MLVCLSMSQDVLRRQLAKRKGGSLGNCAGVVVRFQGNDVSRSP